MDPEPVVGVLANGHFDRFCEERRGPMKIVRQTAAARKGQCWLDRYPVAVALPYYKYREHRRAGPQRDEGRPFVGGRWRAKIVYENSIFRPRVLVN